MARRCEHIKNRPAKLQGGFYMLIQCISVLSGLERRVNRRTRDGRARKLETLSRISYLKCATRICLQLLVAK